MDAGDNRSAMSADRRILNPRYSDNRLKLGVFGANVSNGCAATTAPGYLEMTWPNSRDIVTTADRAGFEALVPVARWRGFGGATDFNGTCYDTLAWAAGMGAVTDHAAIFSTTHVPTIHPIVAAKQCTTVDHLTGGRFALNVVCGWYSQELRMFGLPPMDHDTRYAYADEWVEVVRKLWTVEEEFDYAGRFFKIEKGFYQPKPVQRPHPPIMNAGSSAIGARFAAKHADIAFIGFYEVASKTARPRWRRCAALAVKIFRATSRSGRAAALSAGRPSGRRVITRTTTSTKRATSPRSGRLSPSKAGATPTCRPSCMTASSGGWLPAGAAIRWSAPPSRSSTSWAG
jgi:alkanesulfonate monooxygenase SsuD/methylene tetrahydromethanopterin reductase-like flavin-dependent oxidoreductase (luciferase family)